MEIHSHKQRNQMGAPKRSGLEGGVERWEEICMHEGSSWSYRTDVRGSEASLEELQDSG